MAKILIACKKLKLSHPGFDDKHSPDHEWLLNLYASMVPDDDLFSRE